MGVSPFVCTPGSFNRVWSFDSCSLLIFPACFWFCGIFHIVSPPDCSQWCCSPPHLLGQSCVRAGVGLTCCLASCSVGRAVSPRPTSSALLSIGSVVSLGFALCHSFFCLFYHIFPLTPLQVEEDLLPEVAPAQPELSCAIPLMAGEDNGAGGCGPPSRLLHVWHCAGMGWEAAHHSQGFFPSSSLHPPKS